MFIQISIRLAAGAFRLLSELQEIFDLAQSAGRTVRGNYTGEIATSSPTGSRSRGGAGPRKPMIAARYGVIRQFSKLPPRRLVAVA
jgi:hypothetical protein